MRETVQTPPQAQTICLVSRCSWTFYNFRLKLAQTLAQRTGASVVGSGIDVHSYSQRIVSSGVEFVKLRGQMHGLNPFYGLLFTLDLFRMYRRLRPAIAHHFTIKPVVLGTLAARVAGVPVIINTISGLGRTFDRGSGLGGLLAKLLYRVSLRFSNHVFFQNEEDRHLFIESGLVAAGKSSVVPGSGVDLQHFNPGLHNNRNSDGT